MTRWFDDGARLKLYISTAGDFVSLGTRTEYPFVAGGSGIPTGWTWRISGTGAAFGDVNWTTSYGRFSVSNASATNSHNANFYGIYRDFPVVPGNRYIVQVQARVMDGKTNAYRRLLVAENAQPVTTYGTSLIAFPDWEQISFPVTANAGTTFLRISLDANPYWSDPARQTFDWGVQFQNLTIIDQLPTYPDPTWREVTCDVQSFSARYGRSKFTSRYDVGSCQIGVTNVDGEFVYSPAHPWGLRPGRFVMVAGFEPGFPNQANNLFYGIIDSIGDSFPIDGKATAQLSCVDISSLLSNTNVATAASESTTFISGSRFGLLAASVGWLPQQIIRETGAFVQQTIKANGRTVRDEMGLGADSEGGFFFADRDGRLVFRGRDSTGFFGRWSSVQAELLAECPPTDLFARLQFPGVAGNYLSAAHDVAFNNFNFTMTMKATMDDITRPETFYAKGPGLIWGKNQYGQLTLQLGTAAQVDGYLSPALGNVSTPDQPIDTLVATGTYRLTIDARYDAFPATGNFPNLLQKQGTAREYLLYGANGNTMWASLADGAGGNVDVLVGTVTFGQRRIYGAEWTWGNVNAVTIVDDVRTNRTFTSPPVFTDTTGALQIGLTNTATGRVYGAKLERIVNGQVVETIWKFDANEWQWNRPTVWTDPRGRTWTQSVGTAITGRTNGPVVSTANLPYRDGEQFWIRVDRNYINYGVRFWHAPAMVTSGTNMPTLAQMTQLGILTTWIPDPTFNTMDATVGTQVDGTNPYSGTLERFTIHNGSDLGGTIIFDIRPDVWTNAGNAGDPSFYANTGQLMRVYTTEGYEILVPDYSRPPSDALPIVDAVPTVVNPTRVMLQSLVTDWSRDRVVNDIRLANQGGSAFQVVDKDSQQRYGPRTYQRLDFLNDNTHPEYLLTRSQDLMDGFTDAILRVNSVSFRPNASWPNLYWWTMQVFLNDLVRVRYTHPSEGWGYSVVSRVQSVQHTILTGDWVCVLELDEPLAFNRWDASDKYGWDFLTWDEGRWDGVATGKWSTGSGWSDGISVWK